MTASRALAGIGSGPWPCLLLVLFTAVAMLAVQSGAVINSDVSFLAWTAREVLGGAVFGRDVHEANLPLAALIYAPAAMAAPVFGFPLAIKLWVTLLGCLSVALFWQACDARLRLPVTIAFAVFIALFRVGEFGQREHICFMLVAPYVAGHCRRRGLGILSGVMAGVGFAIKPHFLLPLMLVFATRRKIRSEEVAIALTGAAYALSLLVFFQPYLRDFVPLVGQTYWSTHQPEGSMVLLAGAILSLAVMFGLAGDAQPAARGLLAACIGFAVAALLQTVGFSYHFLPALGFLTLFVTARALNPRPIVAACAVVQLVLTAVFLGRIDIGWILKQPEEQAAVQRFLPEIDAVPSYLCFAVGPYPCFPTALSSGSDYKGLAIWPLFLMAARDPSATPELRERARRLTLDQALHELARAPALVIVERPAAASGWERPPFDLLSWYLTDPGFREQWQHYRFDRMIGAYALYRRKPEA